MLFFAQTRFELIITGRDILLYFEIKDISCLSDKILRDFLISRFSVCRKRPETEDKEKEIDHVYNLVDELTSEQRSSLKRNKDCDNIKRFARILFL